MLESFSKFFFENYTLQNSDKLAVATSGGVDSMVLCHLLLESNIPFSVLHCNFHLRGEESNADTKFVEAFSKKYGLDFEKVDFQTSEYAAAKSISIQMAARELRYQWFHKMKVENNLTWIATAHHLDDDLETLLINLGRGSGLRGLVGIPDKKNGFIRPLLAFTKKQILAYAEEKNIHWREDASNQMADYLRNYLRLEVIPVWKKQVSDLPIGFVQTKKHLLQSLQLQKDYLKLVKKEVWSETEFGAKIDLKKLDVYSNKPALLYELLYSYGFTAWEDIYQLPKSQSGKMVFSPTHRLIKDRKFLLLGKRDVNHKIPAVLLINSYQVKDLMQVLKNNSAKVFKLDTKHTIFVSEKKIRFPLELRLWKPGDFFYPAGMTGKKKLSKYFKDEKYSIIEKEAIWVLCSEEKIVWVVGHRMDRRFSVDKPEEAKIKISI